MGYRLHYAKHYAPQWEGGYFNWKVEQWDNLFFEKFYQNGWKAENADEYEAQRSDIEAYIKELKELKPSDANEFFPGHNADNRYTNKEVIEVLEQILERCEDDSIHMEWF